MSKATLNEDCVRFWFRHRNSGYIAPGMVVVSPAKARQFARQSIKDLRKARAVIAWAIGATDDPNERGEQ